jgi:hypothetical protein
MMVKVKVRGVDDEGKEGAMMVKVKVRGDDGKGKGRWW